MTEIKLYNADCLVAMETMPTESIDCIICDLPYGTTSCKWDKVIPFEPMWKCINRIIKPYGAICLFGKDPFSSQLINSNLYNYKYKWIWNKKQSGNFLNAKYMPLQLHEDIIVFSKNALKVNYYPVMRTGKMRKKGGSNKIIPTFQQFNPSGYYYYSNLYYPTNILNDYPICSNKKERYHPTQKPVNLIEYLIKTYSKEGDYVLDFCMGSGTTGVACSNLNRNFIGIELNEQYFKIAEKRIYKND